MRCNVHAPTNKGQKLHAKGYSLSFSIPVVSIIFNIDKVASCYLHVVAEVLVGDRPDVASVKLVLMQSWPSFARRHAAQDAGAGRRVLLAMQSC